MATLPSHGVLHSLARPADQYTCHAPSKPHIIIPPMADERGRVHLPPYQGGGGDSVTAADLKVITHGQAEFVNNSITWTYEMRRSAQRILPFLYLGPSFAAKDRDFLRREGITLLLVVRDTRTANARLLSGDKVARELGIAAAAVDVADHQQLIAAFPRAIKIINDHLIAVYQQQAQQPHERDAFRLGKVLIFCETGNERSACVVAAYLIYHYGLDLVAAMQYVTTQRFCVAYDDELKHLLLAFHDIIAARRDVIKSQPRLTSPAAENMVSRLAIGNRNGKRALADAEGEMEMDVSEPSVLHQQRSNWAPFQDA